MARNYSAIPADTWPEAWRVQTKAIGRRSVAERLAEWQALNRKGAEMEAEAVRRLHPGFSDREVFLTLVRRRYGDELVREMTGLQLHSRAHSLIGSTPRNLKVDGTAVPEESL